MRKDSSKFLEDYKLQGGILRSRLATRTLGSTYSTCSDATTHREIMSNQHCTSITCNIYIHTNQPPLTDLVSLSSVVHVVHVVHIVLVVHSEDLFPL